MAVALFGVTLKRPAYAAAWRRGVARGGSRVCVGRLPVKRQCNTHAVVTISGKQTNINVWHGTVSVAA